MQRVGDWMQTATGGRFWPLDPRADEVEIADIARSLAMRCRYGGHVKPGCFYSVAEHSVLVSHAVRPEHALWGLLHDAGEAYSADVPRPLKRNLPDWPALEARIMAAVCERFGLDPAEPPEVKAIDGRMIADEQAVIMAPCAHPWQPREPVGVIVRCLPPAEAEALFLARFRALTTEG